MKYNNKNNEKPEIDDLNIKSHLNASLDLIGISVSEDLINRTLQAIKQQPAEQPKDFDSQEVGERKVIPWSRYIRSIAGAAAAVLIVVIGYSVMANSMFGAKKEAKDSAKPEEAKNSVMMDESTDDMYQYATTESATATGDADLNMESEAEQDGSAVQEAPLFTITADSALTKDMGDGTNGYAGVAADELADNVDTEEQARNGEQGVLYTFRDIFLSAPEQAEYIMITDEMNGTTVTLTQQADILEFYEVMDRHQFTVAQEDAIDGQDYELEAKDSQALYTLIVGQNIQVRQVEGDSIKESSYYAVDDALLKQELTEFFNKHSQ